MVGDGFGKDEAGSLTVIQRGYFLVGREEAATSDDCSVGKEVPT